MAYVTQEQLELYMGTPTLAQCCDDTTEGTADADVVADVIARASGILDGYLQTAGYTVPRTGAGITVALRHHTSGVAAHLAARRRPEYRDAQGQAPYRQDYADALAWGQIPWASVFLAGNLGFGDPVNHTMIPYLYWFVEAYAQLLLLAAAAFARCSSNRCPRLMVV